MLQPLTNCRVQTSHLSQRLSASLYIALQRWNAISFSSTVIVIVIVNSKLLKRHLKAKRRATAYSRALRQIRGVFQRIVRGRLRSVFQRVRECVKSEVFSKE